MTSYRTNKAVTPTMRHRLLQVMALQGAVRLDELVDFFDDVSPQYVRVNAEALVEEGVLTAVGGDRHRGGPMREYVLGDGSPEQEVPTDAR